MTTQLQVSTLHCEQLKEWLTGAIQAEADGVERIEVKTENLIELLKAYLVLSAIRMELPITVELHEKEIQ